MHEPPEPGKKGIHQPSCGGLPADGPQQQREKASHPQVGLAHIKHEIQPCWEDGCHQKQIRQNGMAVPGRCQKAVPQPQTSAQHQGSQQPLGGNHRFRHPDSRRQPPSRGSS